MAGGWRRGRNRPGRLRRRLEARERAEERPELVVPWSAWGDPEARWEEGKSSRLAVGSKQRLCAPCPASPSLLAFLPPRRSHEDLVNSLLHLHWQLLAGRHTAGNPAEQLTHPKQQTQHPETERRPNLRCVQSPLTHTGDILPACAPALPSPRLACLSPSEVAKEWALNLNPGLAT